jgi:hypothetical protein
MRRRGTICLFSKRVLRDRLSEGCVLCFLGDFEFLDLYLSIVSCLRPYPSLSAPLLDVEPNAIHFWK